MRWNRRQTKRGGVGPLFLTLFGLPFLAVGVFATYRTAALLWTWHEAKGWVAVEAHVTSVDLEVHSDEDGSTFEAACRYTYEFNGVQYAGDRVGLEQGADNIGDWQKTVHQKLKLAFEKGQPVTCYVDPAHPQRAVLFRELRLAMLGFWLAFGAVFSTAGLAMVFGGAFARRSDAKRKELRARNPRKPWLWRPEWAAGVVRPETGLKVLAAWQRGRSPSSGTESPGRSAGWWCSMPSCAKGSTGW
jgi:hypothetical protein